MFSSLARRRSCRHSPSVPPSPRYSHLQLPLIGHSHYARLQLVLLPNSVWPTIGHSVVHVRSRSIGPRHSCWCSSVSLATLSPPVTLSQSFLPLPDPCLSSSTLSHLIINRSASMPLHLATANGHLCFMCLLLNRRVQTHEIECGGTYAE